MDRLILLYLLVMTLTACARDDAGNRDQNTPALSKPVLIEARVDNTTLARAQIEYNGEQLYRVLFLDARDRLVMECGFRTGDTGDVIADCSFATQKGDSFRGVYDYKNGRPVCLDLSRQDQPMGKLTVTYDQERTGLLFEPELESLEPWKLVYGDGSDPLILVYFPDREEAVFTIEHMKDQNNRIVESVLVEDSGQNRQLLCRWWYDSPGVASEVAMQQLEDRLIVPLPWLFYLFGGYFTIED